MHLTDSVLTIPLVGYRYANLLEKLSIKTVGDLLYHFPTYYKDSSSVGSINTLSKDSKKTIVATLVSLKNIRLRNGKFIQNGIITDGETEIEVIWFNRPFLVKTLHPPVMLILSGKLNPKKIKPQLMSPDFEIAKEENKDEQIHIGRIVPIYSLTSGIFQRWLRTRINYLISNLDTIEDLEETLPVEIREKYSLLKLYDALKLIHFPENQSDIVNARKRLGFDELLNIQKKLIFQRNQFEKQKAYSIKVDKNTISAVINQLPYELTASQEVAIQEIHKDITLEHPMKRLLQGDVGSGKTIVGLLGLLPVLEQGFQVVILAPTTILAQQHYETISRLLDKKYKVALITAKSSKKYSTENNLLVGTHAILANKDKLIHNLGMIVIDEQHRFGVNQRKELVELKTKNFTPHLLQLTATPIPRTIALTLFGDYDVSKIKPPTNKKIISTYLVPETKRNDSVKWIKDKLNEGGQAFWIFPMIEESDIVSGKSVEKFFPQLERTFIDYKVAKLHGKIKNELKEKRIAEFARKEIQILTATTVVEVGIDIPGANIIVIESAERFGLAQLHQLRGRVGRAGQDAWCLLYYNEAQEEVRNRLEYFAKEHDGIKIANFDLNRRGPGEVYGTMQSGLPDLKIARFSNLEQLKQVHEVAKILFK